MLDNGYYYLAATRLSLDRSEADWAMVIETFAFSPRAAFPDTTIDTFASTLHNRDTLEHYVRRDAYELYLANNPYNESRNVFPIEPGPWLDLENDVEFISEEAKNLTVRGFPVPLPHPDEYARHGITLEHAPLVQVFELCRYIAAVARDRVLATPQERRVSALPEMVQIMQLEEWNHPDTRNDDERPSNSETFNNLPPCW